MTGLCTGAGAHLAHTDAVAKARTIDHPDLAVLFNFEFGGRKDFGTFLEEPTGSVAFDGKDSLVGQNFKFVYTATRERGLDFNLLDSAKVRLAYGAGFLQVLFEYRN